MTYEPGFYVVINKYIPGTIRLASKKQDGTWYMEDTRNVLPACSEGVELLILGGPLTKDSLILNPMKGKWQIKPRHFISKMPAEVVAFKVPPECILAKDLCGNVQGGPTWYLFNEEYFNQGYQQVPPDPPKPKLPELMAGMRLILQGKEGEFKVVLMCPVSRSRIGTNPPTSEITKGWMVCDETLRPYWISIKRLERKFLRVDSTEGKHHGTVGS